MTPQFVTVHAKVTIIQCYAPLNDYDDTTKDQFHQHPQDLFNNTPQYDIIILIGNMKINGDKSGFEHVLGPHAYGKCTNDGDQFTQFCAMNNLKIGSTLFQN